MHTTIQNTITIREIRPEELSVVRDLGKRAFPPPMGHLMAATMASQGLVVEDETGTIIGALTLRIVQVGKQKLGILDWGAVDPAHRGKGIAKAVVNQAIVWLQQQGCDRVTTTGVDGYNSGSWNANYAHGLRYWPVSRQIHEFGWRWPQLMFAIPHVIGIGTFILQMPFQKNEREQLDTPETGGIKAMIYVTLLLGLFLLPLSYVRRAFWGSVNISDLFATLNFTTLLVGTGIIAIYVIARTVAHRWAARVLRLPLTFRPWDSGLIMATFLAAALGVFVPGLGGSYYIRQPKFIYSQARSAVGKIMLAGAAASLTILLGFTMWAESSMATSDPIVTAITTLGRYIGISFSMTDTLFFFWPFQSLPAGHIWRWRRSVWLVVCVCFLGIWLILPRVL
ncbi:MAG: GNAT family N-acetyltransferase [Chloroflexota bacterium]|nr:GNAT family N-acetyltransferase [Chloroflexota bacterium]